MKFIRSNLPLLSATAIFTLAIAYVAWQLTGLRYTNHDDVFFNLYSAIYSGDSLTYAKMTGIAQARLQAFVFIPMILTIDSLQQSALFDLVSVTGAMLLLLSIAYYFSRLLGTINAMLLGAFFCFTFALHHYFTFPQGYPVMSYYSLIFGFISAGMFAANIETRYTFKNILSWIFFAISLWGPEYGFVLHPGLLLVAALASTKYQRNWRGLIAAALPYVVVWAGSIIAYLAYSHYARHVGGDAIGRVSFGIDFPAWIKTFLVLQERAFLPFSLFRGIGVNAADQAGNPTVLTSLQYTWHWSVYGDAASLVAVFVISFILVFLIFYFQRFSFRSTLGALLALLLIVTIPTLVVSASALYQKQVLNGWISGHLCTFYAQLGLSGLFFLALGSAVNWAKSGWRRYASLTVASLLASMVMTLTFVYNNANRQTMMALKQRWDAVTLVEAYILDQRPELRSAVLYAPDFWPTVGATSMPGTVHEDGSNYWTAYSRYILKQDFRFSPEQPVGDAKVVGIKYFPEPDGSPVVYIEEYPGAAMQRQTLVSTKPAVGSLINVNSDAQARALRREDWTCGKYCTVQFSTMSDDKLRASFVPASGNSTPLLGQFILPRSNEYAVVRFVRP